MVSINLETENKRDVLENEMRILIFVITIIYLAFEVLFELLTMCFIYFLSLQRPDLEESHEILVIRGEVFG